MNLLFVYTFKIYSSSKTYTEAGLIGLSSSFYIMLILETLGGDNFFGGFFTGGMKCKSLSRFRPFILSATAVL